MHDDQDVVLEPENNEAPKGGDAELKVAKLKAEIEKLRTERQEYLDGWQRAKADYVNALKRFDEEKRGAKEAGTLRAIEAVLPAFDAIERAKEHGELPKGFDAIVKQFESAFKSLAMESFGEVGEVFDPTIHEALGQDKADSAAHADKVTVVLEKGWRIGENVIRPAKVRVSTY